MTGRPARAAARLRFRFLLCLLSLACAARARAAATGGVGGPRPPDGVHDARAAKARMAITIAGEPDCAPPLRDALADQLADIASQVTWSCRPDFEADEPFRVGTGAGTDARVWVDLSGADEARLTLQNERENRFFLRRLPLRAGLDEIGKEEIADVVRSATIAVLTGGAGALTRAEARAAASQWPPPAPRRPPVAVAARSPGPAVRGAAGAPVPPSAPPTVEIGPAFGAQALARQLPFTEEVSLTASISGRGSRLSFWTQAGYRLPASYDDASVGVRLTALSWRAGAALWTSPEAPLRLGFGVGAGVERAWFVPLGEATLVDPAAPDHFDTVVGRVFVSLRLRASAHLVLGLDLLGDVATADVHYDLRGVDGTTRRALTQWPVHPGLSLGAAWRWGA